MAAKAQPPLIVAASSLVNVGWFVTWGLLILCACALLAAPFVDPPRLSIDLAAPTKIELAATAHISSDLEAADISLSRLSGSVLFSPEHPGQIIAGLLIIMAWLGIVLWGLAQFRGLFATLHAGQPFQSANVGRIRRIGYALLAGALAESAVRYMAMRYAAIHFEVEGARLVAWIDIPGGLLFCGLIVLVIAEVFQQGVRLEEDRALTI